MDVGNDLHNPLARPAIGLSIMVAFRAILARLIFIPYLANA